MVMPMVILFVLGGLQGAVGWLMVKSGLVPEKYFVGHVELATHFIMALLLLAYTLWFAMLLRIPSGKLVKSSSIQRLLVGIAVLLFFQLIYGGFMAGLRAAAYAPTWPDINGTLIPESMNTLSPAFHNLVNNPITIHFIHRGLAYLLFILIFIAWWKSRRISGKALFRYCWTITLVLVLVQTVLGILTVLNAPYADRMLWLGVSHQFAGMLLTIMITVLLFITRKRIAYTQ